ncbi:MAG: DUF2130 domain-containing protein [Bacilli bacterium]|nr:DUF2130 domain-containing protein [Bacilli bacterium]
MNEIKCPKCGTLFKIDENEYDKVIKQIRDNEFEKELKIREELNSKEKESAIKLSEASLKEKYNELLSKKDIEINDLKSKLKSSEENKSAEIELTKSKIKKEEEESKNKLNIEILELKNELRLKESEKELAIKEVENKKEKDINDLKNKLDLKENEFLLKEKSLNDSYKEKLKDKDEQIAYYKDFKARQSTKMIGESLEQHCFTEFNKLRPLFPNSYFEKDNDAKTGSKGDFIFRDYDEEKTEIVSIMFEMKNEADETATKHKNEDFFKELDKDRREKKCEYAVLVSMLEMDNDYYNEGIVDVSHKYEKMYVVRPQFFIPIITLIRGAALNSLKYKKELTMVQNQNLDIIHFEDDLNEFKDRFGKNYRLASERFKKAIEEIDKSIDHLQKIKDNLLKSEDNLRLANNKAEDLTITKLTKNNETVKKMFEELKDKKEEE